VVFSGSPFSSTNKNDSHDMTEILLKLALNTITLALTQFKIKLPLFQLPYWMVSDDVTYVSVHINA
jgi:hypothetical protein